MINITDEVIDASIVRSRRAGFNIPAGCYLSYIVVHEHRYPDPLEKRPSIGIQATDREGGAAWEFEVIEDKIPGTSISLLLNMWGDAFPAFIDAAPLFDALAAREAGTLAELRELLDTFGAVDRTDRPGEDEPPARELTGPELLDAVGRYLVDDIDRRLRSGEKIDNGWIQGVKQTGEDMQRWAARGRQPWTETTR